MGGTKTSAIHFTPSITTTIRNINTAVIINNSPINTAVIMEELRVRSLESKMIKDDALAWKQLRVTQNMSSLTYKLKAMQPGLTMNMTCEDPMPSIRSPDADSIFPRH